jgi:hypothetical protein
MDPYLETPALWADFHASFIVYLADALLQGLPDNYEARIRYAEKRMRYIEELQHIEIEDETRVRRIDIWRRPDHKPVAVLELLSPFHKEEPGRTFYLNKRRALIYHSIHLVELDLLLKGQRLPLEEELPAGDYYALISRGDRRPKCDVYAWTMRQALPVIPIPLLAPDPDVLFDLGAVFTTTYDRARYARSLDYTAPPTVSLDAARLTWVRERARGDLKTGDVAEGRP